MKVQGWVRNLPGGDVEALAEGGADEVDAFVRWCHEGPPGADVESVTLLDEQPASGQLKSFEVVA